MNFTTITHDTNYEATGRSSLFVGLDLARCQHIFLIFLNYFKKIILFPILLRINEVFEKQFTFSFLPYLNAFKRCSRAIQRNYFCLVVSPAHESKLFTLLATYSVDRIGID